MLKIDDGRVLKIQNTVLSSIAFVSLFVTSVFYSGIFFGNGVLYFLKSYLNYFQGNLLISL